MWTHRERADLRDKGTILKPFKEHLRPYCRRRTRATLRTCFAATVKSRYFAEPVQPLRQNVICDNPRSLWRVRGASFLAGCNFTKLVNRQDRVMPERFTPLSMVCNEEVRQRLYKCYCGSAASAYRRYFASFVLISHQVLREIDFARSPLTRHLIHTAQWQPVVHHTNLWVHWDRSRYVHSAQECFVWVSKSVLFIR